MQLWRHWDDVQLYKDPVGWVRRVAINRAFNRRRTLARRTAALLRLAEREQSAGTIVAGEPWEPSLMAAFRALPARQRLAMGLHYVADLSVAEVASSMGVSEGSVKQHLHRGRETMRHYLENAQ